MNIKTGHTHLYEKYTTLDGVKKKGFTSIVLENISGLAKVCKEMIQSTNWIFMMQTR